MSIVTAILEPDADGSLHLPLPANLRSGRVRVVASLTPVALERDQPAAACGKSLREWLHHARGSVRSETGGAPANDLRMEYYAQKYGVKF